MINNENYTMLCDFYELTMGNGYFNLGRSEEITYFDVFFRNIPDDAGYAIFAGLEQLVDYIKNLHFTEEDIQMLREKGLFDEAFLSYLSTFRFTGDIYAMREGTPIFPGEPIITVRAPAVQAQLIETFVLLSINHQSLIASKASRIVRAAEGRPVLVRLPPCAGNRRRDLGRPCRLYRRMQFHRLHHRGAGLRYPRLRHHGTFLGADV